MFLLCSAAMRSSSRHLWVYSGLQGDEHDKFVFLFPSHRMVCGKYVLPMMLFLELPYEGSPENGSRTLASSISVISRSI